MTRTAFVVGLVGVGACRNCSEAPKPTGPSPLEASIGRALSKRVNATVTVECQLEPPRCVAYLVDGTQLPIALATHPHGWDWRIDGLLVRALDVEGQVHAALVDLDRDQTVHCGARVRRIAPDDLVTCTLGGGGQAFARIATDGGVALELELDAAAAAARSEASTPDHEAALEAQSAALAGQGGDEDDDEMASDGGVDGSVDASAAQL